MPVGKTTYPNMIGATPIRATTTAVKRGFGLLHILLIMDARVGGTERGATPLRATRFLKKKDMKKLIAIIALFISVFAYGQEMGFVKVYYGDRYNLVFGDYVSTLSKSEKGGEWEFSFKTDDEADNFYYFIKNNYEEIEKKCDLLFVDYKFREGYKYVEVKCWDRQTLEKKQKDKAAAEERAEREKMERMNSLKGLL